MSPSASAVPPRVDQARPATDAAIARPDHGGGLWAQDADARPETNIGGFVAYSAVGEKPGIAVLGRGQLQSGVGHSGRRIG